MYTSSEVFPMQYFVFLAGIVQSTRLEGVAALSIPYDDELRHPNDLGQLSSGEQMTAVHCTARDVVMAEVGGEGRW